MERHSLQQERVPETRAHMHLDTQTAASHLLPYILVYGPSETHMTHHAPTTTSPPLLSPECLRVAIPGTGNTQTEAISPCPALWDQRGDSF